MVLRSVARHLDISVEQTNHREGREALKTTYEFESIGDGSDLGTIDHRGGKDAYGFAEGDEVDLVVDPDGTVPPQLEERVEVVTRTAHPNVGAR